MDLNLAVARGKFLTMLDPSGSGKSTCLMMLDRFETEGTIRPVDRSINRVRWHRRSIGTVYQNFGLVPHMSEAETLACPIEVRPGSIRNNFIDSTFSTLIAAAPGTIAAPGLSQSSQPFNGAIMALLISPMIVPVIIAAAGMYFFYSLVGLSQTLLGLILARATLGTPFVVVPVTATLSGFDRSPIRASANLGAAPVQTFFNIIVPLVGSGVFSDALFAFITSFDEVVAVLFLSGTEMRTVPQAGIRDSISRTILAVATLLGLVSVLLLAALELLRRRNERLRGVRT